MHTKKVGTTGRYGARYGRRIRKAVRKIEKEQKKRHPCPKCKFERLKRKDTGVWLCTKCNVKIAGGAYLPIARR
jgi:large subunit ribosomal protein L37Ae